MNLMAKKMSKPKKSKPAHILADCIAPIQLRCSHCDRLLPQSASLETFANYVVVECPKCRCRTPFQLEQSA